MSTTYECGLAHHRPGCRVKFNRWSAEAHDTVVIHATVVSHQRRVIAARCEPDGHIERLSCGAAVAE